MNSREWKKNAAKLMKASDSHLEAKKLFKKAQALMNEAQLLREDITSDRNKVEKEKNILAVKSKRHKRWVC